MADQPTSPCDNPDPHIAHRAWTTDEAGVCPGIPPKPTTGTSAA